MVSIYNTIIIRTKNLGNKTKFLLKHSLHAVLLKYLYRIDPTDVPEEECVAKFINHSRHTDIRNLAALCKKVNGVPRLVYFATKDIQVGTQLFIDYGVRDKKELEDHPFMKKTPQQKQ